jgi:predicted amidohydrolase YtcJ
VFGKDNQGNATLNGYVDTASNVCVDARAHEAVYAEPVANARFITLHGYRPAQCTESSGRLQHPRAVILEYLKRMHMAGFTLHIHAVGDEAVRTAIDGIEQARAADGISSRPDTIAHLQLVAPDDIARIGRDHLFTVYTFSWAQTNKGYDLSVIPFVEHVVGDNYAALHDPASYYERNAYPTLSTKKVGGVLTAGSDAPVSDRDPRPFLNMQTGITRARPGGQPLGPQERLNVRDVIDAYTINNARALGREAEIGSLELGKSADFIMLDRDIIGLADNGHADQIGDSRVLATWFQGRIVYDGR